MASCCFIFSFLQLLLFVFIIFLEYSAVLPCKKETDLNDRFVTSFCIFICSLHIHSFCLLLLKHICDLSVSLFKLCNSSQCYCLCQETENKSTLLMLPGSVLVNLRRLQKSSEMSWIKYSVDL